MSNFKKPMIRDEKHKAFIRTLPCIRCGSTPSQAAHVRTAANSGVSMKPSDSCLVPACEACHRLQHQIGQLSFFGNIEATLELANALFVRTGDTLECLKLLDRHKWKVLGK